MLANATRPETKINLKSFKILLLGFKKAFISGYITIPLKTFEYNSIGLLHIEKQFKALGGGFIWLKISKQELHTSVQLMIYLRD